MAQVSLAALPIHRARDLRGLPDAQIRAAQGSRAGRVSVRGVFPFSDVDWLRFSARARSAPR